MIVAPNVRVLALIIGAGLCITLLILIITGIVATLVRLVLGS